MPGSLPVRWTIILLCGALAAFGCASTETEQGAAGSLSLNLVLAGGIEIDVVDWEITGNGMDMGGSVDVSAPGSTASVEVFGLPVGQEPYVVELSAVSVDEQVTCRGSAEFDIEVGVSTPVMVMLNCKQPEELGAVRVNGKLNICAQLSKVVVSPLQTSVGNDISLSSAAQDEEGDPIAYKWSSGSGSIADPTAASTTYTCTEVGDDDITILVSDDGGSYCMSMWTVRVTCVAGEGNPCDDVTCEDDGNECTSEACNPSTGACESSPVGDGTSCADATGVCMSGECVPNDLCMDVVCEDDGNECTDEACNPANGMCETSNNSNACDGGNGTCNAGVCEPNPECAVDADCPDTGNECIDPVCNAGTCGTSNNSNACDGGNGTCSAGVCEPNPECTVDADCPDTGNECIDAVCDAGTCGTSNNSNACDGGNGTCSAGVCEPNPECVVDADCPDTGNECIDPVCNAGTCETSNNSNACDGGAGTCDAGVCEPNAVVFYEQGFESLDQASGSALGDAGFFVFGNEFLPDGTPIQGYGPFPAPNGTPGFCSIALAQGGTEQGAQQLVIYSDYNNTANQTAGNLVEANTFQEPFGNANLITVADLGTYTFSFDAKRGDINNPADPVCASPNVCDSTAVAFIKTLDPGAGFATTNNITLDTTALPDTWNRYSIEIVVDNALIGQILQFGFAATATNFEPSGVFYDNLLVTVE